jgi:hypothetical protein
MPISWPAHFQRYQFSFGLQVAVWAMSQDHARFQKQNKKLVRMLRSQLRYQICRRPFMISLEVVGEGSKWAHLSLGRTWRNQQGKRGRYCKNHSGNPAIGSTLISIGYISQPSQPLKTLLKITGN